MISHTRKKAQAFLAGDGVDLDVDKAVMLLIQAANAGEAACFYDLAETYFDGVPEDDPQKALHYLEAAGNTGHGKSCAYMARLYANESVFYSPEDLVKPNAEISFEWCQKGLELSDPECMLKIAKFHVSSNEKDRAEIVVKKALDHIEHNDSPDYSSKELESIKSELSNLNNSL